MRPTPTFHRTGHALSVTLIASAALALAGAPAQAGQKKCGGHSTQVASVKASDDPKYYIASFWSDKGKLWSCVFSGWRNKPQNRVLGPWTKQSKIAIAPSGSGVIWTQRTKVLGQPADLIWAVDYDQYDKDPAFLSGVKPALDAQASKDLRVAGIKAGGYGVGWVTKGGAVSFAFQNAPDVGSAIGAGTAGAVDPMAPGSTDAASPGLFPEPIGVQTRVQIGRWAHAAPSQLVSSLTITPLDNGEFDDCGGSRGYRLTTLPVAGQPAVGVEYGSVSWTGDPPQCR